MENIREIFEYMLFLTIIASYYTNSEKIPFQELPSFTIKALDCFVNYRIIKKYNEECKWNEHIKYLSRHKEVYDKILYLWEKILDNKGMLKE
jgi:hypothetical protein